MSFQTISPITLTQNVSLPPLYQGKVDIQVLVHRIAKCTFLQAQGDNLQVESIQGDYSELLHSSFGVEKRDEIKALTPLLGHNNVEEFISLSASKTSVGVYFSGYSIIEKTSQKIIGLLTFTGGTETGESLCNLIIGKEHRNKRYGIEAAALGAGLALLFKMQDAYVSNSEGFDIIKKYSVNVPANDDHTISWLTKLGLKKMRMFEEKGTNMSVYGVESHQFDEVAKKIMNLDNFVWKINKVGGSSPVRNSPTVNQIK